jgi:hypothetical protein
VEARSYPSCMGICICPNGRLMLVVELCKLSMGLRIDVPLLMKMIDGCLRPINTIMSRILVLATNASERTGDRPCTPFTVDLAKDVVVRPLKSGVVAMSPCVRVRFEGRHGHEQDRSRREQRANERLDQLDRDGDAWTNVRAVC